MSSVLRVAAAALVLALLNFSLGWKAFLPGESPYRQSIELSYVAMARWVQQHPDFWGWKPLQYLGIPTAFQYVPALPYTAAAFSTATGSDIALVHRTLTASATALLPVTAFLLSWYFTRRLRWSLLAGLVLTFFSPIYGLIPAMDLDRSPAHLPWRWQLLLKYGEGPHNVGLALIPLALIAVTEWTSSRSKRWLGIAAFLFALIPLTNWIAALALALTMVCWILTSWRNFDALRRAVLAGVLAYGLAAFALTPTFIRTIAFNWPVDSPNFEAESAQRLALGGVLLSLIGLRVLLAWLGASFGATFFSLCTWLFGSVLVLFGFYKLDVIPEAHRYAMEFELFLILALCAWAKAAWDSGLPTRKALVLLFAIAMLTEGLYQPLQFVGSHWSWYQRVPSPQTVEYQMAKWLSEHQGQGRALVSGGLRFRINAWFDVPIAGGGFESGTKSRTSVDWASRIRHDLNDAERAIERMQAMGIEYVAVHGPKSTEFYRDYRDPLKFEGKLERVYASGDDVIYRVPFRSLAEWAGKPLGFRWRNPSEAEIDAQAGKVNVKLTYDPGWRATQGDSAIEVRADANGLLELQSKNNARILLRFGPTAEQIACAALSLGAWIYWAFLWTRKKTTAPVIKVTIVRKRPTETSAGV
jgi:hypothetical protein